MRKSAVLLIALSLIMLACRSSTATSTVVVTEPPSPVPETTTSSSPLTTTTSPAPTTTTVSAAFPVTVATDLGSVTIETRPERIVSLSATHTEMLYAIGAGDQVVGTDLTSNFPEEAATTAKVDSFNFNVEDVVALAPDLVVVAFDFQGEAEALGALGIPFLLLGPPTDLDGAWAQLEQLGRATGHGEQAAALAEQLASEVDRLVAASAPIGGVTIFHEVEETLYSASSESFIGDVYARLGLVNIADDAGVAGQFPQLSAEYIVDRSPEFIFLADANFGVTAESVAARPGWDTIRAVIDDRIVALDGDIAGRWGPRTVDLMRSIFEAVESEVP